MGALRTSWWAVRASRSARRGLREAGLGIAPLPAPPREVAHHPSAVETALKTTRATCLERSLVLQAVHSANARPPPDVVIGVTERDGSPRFHAWLDGVDPAEVDEYAELARIRHGTNPT